MGTTVLAAPLPIQDVPADSFIFQFKENTMKNKVVLSNKTIGWWSKSVKKFFLKAISLCIMIHSRNLLSA